MQNLTRNIPHIRVDKKSNTTGDLLGKSYPTQWDRLKQFFALLIGKLRGHISFDKTGCDDIGGVFPQQGGGGYVALVSGCRGE